jgi:hypothetical protein
MTYDVPELLLVGGAKGLVLAGGPQGDQDSDEPTTSDLAESW